MPLLKKLLQLQKLHQLEMQQVLFEQDE